MTNQKISTRDEIIKLLSEKWPLTTKQIYIELTKKNRRTITYQAIHKILTQLKIETTLKKTENRWGLDTNWLQEKSQFFTNTSYKYSNKKNRYSFDPHFNGTQTFEFDNITALSVETAKLLSDDSLQQNNTPFHCILEYGWWTLKFRFEDVELLYKMIQKCPASKHIIQKKTKFGKWIHKQYLRVGGNGKIGCDIGLKRDFFVAGEYVIDVDFSLNAKGIIKKYWEDWHELGDLFHEFWLKPEPEATSKVQIYKNNALAQFVKREVEKYVQTPTQVNIPK